LSFDGTLPMKNFPRRTIRGALLDQGIGPVTIEELLAMTENEWGVFRDRITDKRNGKDSGIQGKCLACGSPVYIASRANHNAKAPYFAHYEGGDLDCPWYHGPNMTPDSARAAQYQGNQESVTHRLMCEAIAEAIGRDSRAHNIGVDRYLAPIENENGRYPDVFFTLGDFGKFAIEFQLSNTFQTEISSRCLHYEREQVNLIWVLYGQDPHPKNFPQSFRDVTRRHRGNAFFLMVKPQEPLLRPILLS
jgi:hypothetical protein